MIKNCRTPATRRSNRTILAETSAQAKSVAIGPAGFSGRPEKTEHGVGCTARQVRENHAKSTVGPWGNPVTGRRP